MQNENQKKTRGKIRNSKKKRSRNNLPLQYQLCSLKLFRNSVSNSKSVNKRNTPNF